MHSKNRTRLRVICIFWFVLFYSLESNSQTTEPDSSLVKRNGLNAMITSCHINYLGVGLGQERKVNFRSTILYAIGLHHSFYSIPPIFGTRFIQVLNPLFGYDYTVSALTPYISCEVRRYINLAHRLASKNTNNNAASFVAVFVEVPLLAGKLTETPNLALVSPVGIKMGGRRNLTRYFYAEMSLAVVGKISPSLTTLVPRIDLSLGLPVARR